MVEAKLPGGVQQSDQWAEEIAAYRNRDDRSRGRVVVLWAVDGLGGRALADMEELARSRARDLCGEPAEWRAVYCSWEKLLRSLERTEALGVGRTLVDDVSAALSQAGIFPRIWLTEIVELAAEQGLISDGSLQVLEERDGH